MNALRIAASWLLVVCVFFGPAGLGGAEALANTLQPCGISCPCDETASADHPEDHDGCDCNGEIGSTPPSEGVDDHDHGAPCQDDCSDDCPNCGCCLGVALAVLPVPMTSTIAPSKSLARMNAPADAPGNGARTGVFRPPRPLA